MTSVYLSCDFILCINFEVELAPSLTDIWIRKTLWYVRKLCTVPNCIFSQAKSRTCEKLLLKYHLVYLPNSFEECIVC